MDSTMVGMETASPSLMVRRGEMLKWLVMVVAMLAATRHVFTVDAFQVLVLRNNQRQSNEKVQHMAFTVSSRRDDEASLQSSVSSRDVFLQTLSRTAAVTAAVVAAGTTSTILPLPVHAAVLAESNSIITNQLAVNEALRSVKATQKRLASSTVRDMIVSLDYAALQSLLRTPPISEIRKNCRVLVKQQQAAMSSLDTTASSNTATNVLEQEYTTFIQALEQLDTTAMTAIRGKTIASSDYVAAYDKMLASLTRFRELAEEQLLVPTMTITTAAQ